MRVPLIDCESIYDVTIINVSLGMHWLAPPPLQLQASPCSGGTLQRIQMLPTTCLSLGGTIRGALECTFAAWHRHSRMGALGVRQYINLSACYNDIQVYFSQLRQTPPPSTLHPLCPCTMPGSLDKDVCIYYPSILF